MRWQENAWFAFLRCTADFQHRHWGHAPRFLQTAECFNDSSMLRFMISSQHCDVLTSEYCQRLLYQSIHIFKSFFSVDLAVLTYFRNLTADQGVVSTAATAPAFYQRRQLSSNNLRTAVAFRRINETRQTYNFYSMKLWSLYCVCFFLVF